MEENQDLKVCQNVGLCPLERNYGNITHQRRNSDGYGEGVQTWDFGCVCFLSLIEREGHVLNMAKR